MECLSFCFGFFLGGGGVYVCLFFGLVFLVCGIPVVKILPVLYRVVFRYPKLPSSVWEIFFFFGRALWCSSWLYPLNDHYDPKDGCLSLAEVMFLGIICQLYVCSLFSFPSFSCSSTVFVLVIYVSSNSLHLEHSFIT